ncbi:MAG: hypothetical protein Q7S79_00625 [bacterium]|nr:hypothetical protein [bacterium]
MTQERTSHDNRASFGTPEGKEAAKRARRAAEKAHRQRAQELRMWKRRAVLASPVAAVAVIGGISYAVQAHQRDEEAKTRAASDNKVAVSPAENSLENPRSLDFGKSYFGRNYVLTNLVEGLEVEINPENLDRLYNDERVGINITRQEAQGINFVNLLFIAPLYGVTNDSKEIVDAMMLIDPKVPVIKATHQQTFSLPSPLYRVSSLPFYSVAKSVINTSSPSAGEKQRLAIKLSEDLIRASTQSTAVPLPFPIISISPNASRAVEEYPPLRIVNLDSRAISPIFNPR